MKRINKEANDYLENTTLEPLSDPNQLDTRERPRGIDLTTLKLFRVGTGYEIFKDEQDKNRKYLCVYFPLFNAISKTKKQQREN